MLSLLYEAKLMADDHYNETRLGGSTEDGGAERPLVREIPGGPTEDDKPKKSAGNAALRSRP